MAESPVEAYGKLSQEERTQLATKFLEEIKKAQPDAYAQFASVDVNTVTPEQLEQLHEHTAHHMPDVFGEVMKHPVITAAAGGLLAGFAVYEVDKHIGKK